MVSPGAAVHRVGAVVERDLVGRAADADRVVAVLADRSGIDRREAAELVLHREAEGRQLRLTEARRELNRCPIQRKAAGGGHLDRREAGCRWQSSAWRSQW